MLPNRSIPHSTVIPELAYPDVNKAAAWLCDVFGFTMRLTIGNHRVQLNVGDGAVVVTERHKDTNSSDMAHSVMVRIEDVNRHHQKVQQRGAQILRPPADYPYGERQYTVRDPGGHVWTFTQSISDVDPKEWGGTPGHL